MSTERDQYPRHHGGHGGTAFIYLRSPTDVGKAIQALRKLEGVEEVLTRDEAAKKYRLNPHRMGDVWVTAMKDVVFGHSTKERVKLPKDYRSHGSAHEQEIPCFIYRYATKLPIADGIGSNVDLGKLLYRKESTP